MLLDKYNNTYLWKKNYNYLPTYRFNEILIIFSQHMISLIKLNILIIFIFLLRLLLSIYGYETVRN